MGGQEVFKGAAGWDDWIWWSGIGGVGLFFLMLLLCCVVCVQRAKRKGRDEALAVVHARERERQQQEQAQLRYAQAQQARYPTREPSFKFSKPEPPQPNYNPYGHDDHQMARNSFSQPPVARPKPRRGSQLAPPVEQHQQQQQQPLYSAAAHKREEMPPFRPQHQEQELPQVAAYYGHQKPQPDLAGTTPPQHTGRKMSAQYQRQQQVNPQQPPIMQYRKNSNRSYTSDSPFHQDTESLQEVPFVQVHSPRGSNASTVSATSYSAMPVANSRSQVAPPPGSGGSSSSNNSNYTNNNNYNNNRASVSSVSSSSNARAAGGGGGAGGTLRDRIDALREGGASVDNQSRMSTSSSISGGSSLAPPAATYRFSSSPPRASTITSFHAALAGANEPARRTQVVSGTVLSDVSYTTNDDENRFDEEVFGTARSGFHGSVGRQDSDESVGTDSGGQFENADSPLSVSSAGTPKARKHRAGTDDSNGSIEF